MGDISEMRGLIFLVCLVGSVMFLMAWMPAQLYPNISGTPTTRDTRPAEVMAWNGTYILNMTSGMDESFEINGRTVRVEHSTVMVNAVTMWTFHYEWWIFYYADYFTWTQGGVTQSSMSGGAPALDLSTMDSNYLTDNQSGLIYVVDNKQVQYDIVFNFNTTAYEKPSDALAANALQMLIAYDFDDRGSSINAFSVISMLFFGQLPNVDPTLNALIALGMWAVTGYLVFIFALRVIGAVFGGGGA